MIQFNLLPDVKLEYIKAQRMRRLITSVSAIVTVISVALLILVLVGGAFQKKHLNDLNNDIASQTATIQKEPQFNNILTVQNQLESLTTLHNGKPAATRLFSYLNQVTPNSINITTFNIDYVGHALTITGTTDALSTVNQFVDTLKFTTYTVKDDTTNTKAKAFSNVVLTSFGLNSGSSSTGDNATLPGQAASYTIGLTYDPPIFDITKNVTLAVPNLVTTRSEIDKPSDLFTDAPAGSASAVTSKTTTDATSTAPDSTGGTH